MFTKENIYHHVSSQIDSDGIEMKETCAAIEKWCEVAKIGDTTKYDLPNWLVFVKMTENHVEVTVGRVQASVEGSTAPPSNGFKKYIFPL